MIVLALDTALVACAACAFDTERDKVVASESVIIGRGHAEALLPMMERVLAKVDGGWSKIGRIGVVTGPGSFTGLRVGIAVARAAALATGKPAIGITTLAALAAPIVAVSDGAEIVAAIDARHGNIYVQSFSANGKPLGEPSALSAEDAAAAMSDTSFHLVGSGAPALHAALARLGKSARSVTPDAVADIVQVAKLAASTNPRFAPAHPLYVKAADARATVVSAA